MNLQQLKQIVRIADYLNTEEKEKEFYIHSPFRSEKTPSFKINPIKNTWYDFGAGFWGTILDLVMKLENKDTKQAVKKLRELAGDTTSSNNNFFSFPQQKVLIPFPFISVRIYLILIILLSQKGVKGFSPYKQYKSKRYASDFVIACYN